MSNDQTALPEPPWSTARPRRTTLTREAITDAALRMVDAEGMDGLSMRKLAEQLGRHPSALYAHVSGRAELLQLLIDRVAAELHVPDPEPSRWQEQVKEVMRAMHASFLSHRDLAVASLASFPTGPAALTAMDRLLAILLAGGLPRRVAAHAADLLVLYVTAIAYEEVLLTLRDPEYFEQMDAYFHALPAERFPTFAGMVDLFVGEDDSAERFEFGLDALMRGLSAFVT